MITWREKMSIDGDGVIDQDHKHLIEIINRFEKLASDGLDKTEASEILYALKFYTETHFGREEQLQRLCEFPYADAHHHEHMELIKTLDDLIVHLSDSKEEDLGSVHREISDLLREWLIGHILHSDLKMQKYVTLLKKHAENLGALKDLEVSVE